MWPLLHLLDACTSDSHLATSAPEDPAAEGPPAWLPGDEIPGWEDYPCEEELPAFVTSTWIVFEAVEVESRAACVWPDDYEWCDSAESPTWTLMVLCNEGEDDPDCSLGTSERIRISFSGDVYLPRDPRGQGWYDFTIRGLERSGWAQLYSDVYGVAETYYSASASSGYDDVPPDGMGCLSRVRPDEMSGVAYIDFRREPRDDRPEAYILPFHFRFPDHGGRYSCATPSKPDEVKDRHYEYTPSTDYDEFWPWEEITDDDVRQQVYERYTPYGWDERFEPPCPTE